MTRRIHGRTFLVVALGLLTALVLGGCMGAEPTPSGSEASEQQEQPLAAESVLQTSPPRASIPATVQRQFSATLLRPRNRPKTLLTGVAWSVSDTTVASVDATGLVTALRPGTVTVTAADQGLTATSTLTVTSATLVSVDVDPPARKIQVGTHASFRATGAFSDGTTFPLGGAVTWLATTPAVATVNSTGRATAVAAGITAIQATHTATGLRARAFLTVGSASLKSLAIAPPTSSTTIGSSVPLLVTGTFSDRSTQDLTDTATWSTSSSSVATISNASGSQGVATAAGAGTTTIKAVVARKTATTVLTVTSATLVSIAIRPATVSIPNGLTAQLVATGTYSDHTTQDITALVTWTSSSSAVFVSNATGSSGLATAIALGIATVMATDASGITATATVTVTAAVLEALSVTPPTSTVPVGVPQPYAAIGTFTDATTRDMTSSVTWSSTSPLVAAVSSTGLASALAVGTTTIGALDPMSGLIATASLTVSPAVLESLAITPASTSIANGLTEPFIAIGIFSDGSHTDLTSTVSWSVPSGTAVVSSTGIAASNGVGPSTIEAALGAITTTATLNVTAATIVAIQVTPALPSLPLGTTRHFGATAIFTDGSTMDVTGAVTWSSTNVNSGNPDATISNVAGSNGLVTATAVGSTTITATYPSASAPSGSTVLTVKSAALVSIAVTPTSPSLPAGATQQFAAAGTYTDGTTTDITDSVTWASSAPAVLSVSSAAGSVGLGTALVPGSTTLSAVDPTTGIVGATLVTITAAELVSIQVTPASLSIGVGRTQALAATGTYSDGSTQNLTTSVTWSSSGDAATVSNVAGSNGVATGQAAGNTVITATDPTTLISGSTTLAVTGSVLVSIAVAPATASIAVGGTVQFLALGTFSDGTQQVLTSTATWSSSSPSAAISNAAGTNGLATGLVAGVATITALDPTTQIQGGATLTTAALVSVQVTPETPGIAVGQTGVLTATGSYTDGSTRNIASAVAWSSSDPAIASISSAGVIGGVALGSARITATDPLTLDTASVTVTVTATSPVVSTTIGAAGGTLTSADGALALRVPASAVSSGTVFSVQQVPAPAPGTLGPVYDLEPSGVTFNPPVSLLFNYAGVDLAGIDPTSLSLASYDGTGWDAVASGTDVESTTIGADVSHFSTWGFYPPAPSGFIPAQVQFRITTGSNGVGSGDVVDAVLSDGSVLKTVTLHAIGDAAWAPSSTTVSGSFPVGGIKPIRLIEILYIPDAASPTGCSNVFGCKWDLASIAMKGSDTTGASTYCVDNQSPPRCGDPTLCTGLLKTLSVPWASKGVALLSDLVLESSALVQALLSGASGDMQLQGVEALTLALFDQGNVTVGAGYDTFESSSGDGCARLVGVNVTPSAACVPDDPNIQLQLLATADYRLGPAATLTSDVTPLVTWSVPPGSPLNVSSNGVLTVPQNSLGGPVTVTATDGVYFPTASVSVDCVTPGATSCCFGPGSAPICQSQCQSGQLEACASDGQCATQPGTSCRPYLPGAGAVQSVQACQACGSSVGICCTGQTMCPNDICADLTSDGNNCGTCGYACPQGNPQDFATCISGACVCESSTAVICNPGTATAVCAELTSDPSNCGSCGAACPQGQVCKSGQCSPCFQTSDCPIGNGFPACCNGSSAVTAPNSGVGGLCTYGTTTEGPSLICAQANSGHGGGGGGGTCVGQGAPCTIRTLCCPGLSCGSPSGGGPSVCQ